MAAEKRKRTAPGLWNIQVIGTPKGMLVTGVVLKKPATPLGPEGTWWSTLKKTIRTYFLSPYVGAFILRCNGKDHRITTNKHGGFATEIDDEFSQNLQFLDSEGENRLSLLHSYPHNFDYRKAPYIVISDIDDTILVSNSAKFFSKLWLMLFRQTDRRNFVEETEHAYRKLKEKVPFAYVSASEYNLYSIITNFISYHDLPLGPVLLRPFQRWNKVLDETDRRQYKIDRINQLMNQYPDTKFVLFGDDSQDDPGVYRETIKKFDGRVHSVYLRKTGFVSDKKNKEKLEQFTGKTDVYSYEHFDEIKTPINALIDEATDGRQPHFGR